jgi:hypothetical protein
VAVTVTVENCGTTVIVSGSASSWSAAKARLVDTPLAVEVQADTPRIPGSAAASMMFRIARKIALFSMIFSDPPKIHYSIVTL